MAEEYAVYFIPWIVNNQPNWWGSINIKNKSNFNQNVKVTYEDIDGDVIGNETIIINSNSNHSWLLEDIRTRSVTIEATKSLFVTAFMGVGNVGSNAGFTELSVREITNLKN